MRPRKNNDCLESSNYFEQFKGLFANCYSENDFKIRMKQIYKGKNPEKMTDEERKTFILQYLHPEKSEKQIRKEAFEMCENERKLFESLEDFSKSIEEIELPDIDIDIPELDFNCEDYDFNLPEGEIDSTELDKVLNQFNESEEEE